MIRLALDHHRQDILTELILKGADPNSPGLIQAAVKSGDIAAVT